MGLRGVEPGIRVVSANKDYPLILRLPDIPRLPQAADRLARIDSEAKRAVGMTKDVDL